MVKETHLLGVLTYLEREKKPGVVRNLIIFQDRLMFRTMIQKVLMRAFN